MENMSHELKIYHFKDTDCTQDNMTDVEQNIDWGFT